MSEESGVLFGGEDIKDLDFTRNIRKNAIKKLTEEGPLPSRQYNRMLIDLLDGLDRQILSKASIKTQDESNKKTAELAAKMLLQVQTVDNVIAQGGKITPPKKKIKVSPNDVPGELEIGEANISLNDIVK